MKEIIFVVAIVLISIQVRSQSYDGFIGKKYPVWFELEIPVSDGPVKGLYFYKKYGNDIFITGNKVNKTIIVKEYGKNDKIAGIIECIIKYDSIIGTWKKPDGRSSHSLQLKKADATLKKYAKAMSGKELQLARSEMDIQTGKGKTLAGELTCDGCVNEDGSPLNGPADLDVYYAGNDIFSTSYHWAYFGAYFTGGNNYHTFDLLTNKEIVLWDEIDEKKSNDFNRYLNDKITPMLAQTRKEYPDSEWTNAFYIWMHDNESDRIRDSVGEFFKIDDIRKDCFNPAIVKGTNYYIDKVSLHLLIYNYFDLPHAIDAMDAGGDVVISLSELKNYLKMGSVFRKLFKN